MESFFAKARAFAEETAKKSHDLVTRTTQYTENVTKESAFKSFKEIAEHATKRTKELAEETARQSKILAEEASRRSRILADEAVKKAEEYKVLVKEFTLTSLTEKKNDTTSEEELKDYGITSELREFVKSLTLDTFKGFPLEDGDVEKVGEEVRTSGPQVSNDLTDWQVHHAMLVLKLVPEISKFRYDLCPRFMQEKKFWKIYFVVVKSHVAKFESAFSEKMREAHAAEVKKSVSEKKIEDKMLENSGLKSKKSLDSDQDLDAYLLGALDGESGEADDEEGEFDPDDFDQFVNNVELSESNTENKDKGKNNAEMEEVDEGVLVKGPSEEK